MWAPWRRPFSCSFPVLSATVRPLHNSWRIGSVFSRGSAVSFGYEVHDAIVLALGSGGLIGGAVGAATWAAITYYTNHEIGYVAWGVGILVGFCVRFAAGSDEGFGPGLTAAAIAIVALVGGKYAATSLLVDKVFAEMPMIAAATPADMQEGLMSEIVMEWTEAKKPMKWPAGKTLENAESTADYPPEVVKEAETRWNALKPEEQQAQIRERTESIQALASSLKEMARQEGFKASFTPIDILFFLLAIGSAWKLGSGVASGE